MEIKYRGKTIIIEHAGNATIVRTNKHFRRAYGTDQEVTDKLVNEIKELIDYERDR